MVLNNPIFFLYLILDHLYLIVLIHFNLYQIKNCTYKLKSIMLFIYTYL